MRALALLLALQVGLLGAAFASGPDCAAGPATGERHVPRSLKRAVFLAAGVPYDHQHRRLYVVDHIIPLELAGTNDRANLQLQTVADGHTKDAVEDALRRCVCRGLMPLTEARRRVVTWREVDRLAWGESLPISRRL